MLAALAVLASPPRAVRPLPNELLSLDALRAGGAAQVALRNRRRVAAAGAPGADDWLRIRLDDRALHEHSAHPGTCFAAGARYERGIVVGDGVECDGTARFDNCWGVCAERDVVTPERRDALVELVRRVVDDFRFLRLARAEGDPPLALAPGVGTHSAHYRAHGIPDDAEACARDCLLLNGYAAPEALCNGTGLADTDVVIALFMTPVLPGVAASAGPCAFAGNRPVVGVLNWHMAGPSGSMDALVQAHTGLIRHELLHALGYLESSFRAAGLVAPRAFADRDGAVETAWAFLPHTNVAAAAAAHFNCADEPVHVPLMTYPELGEHNHFSTRVQRDDVMTYGHAKRVSSITLAAMEDLGVGYVPAYDRAECVRWGRNQGCAFLASRCGVGRHDHGVVVEGAAQCAGRIAWREYADPHLEAKCAFGSDPCGIDAFDAATSRCDAQCASAEAEGVDCVANFTHVPLPRHERDVLDEWWVGWWWFWLLFFSWIGLTALIALSYSDVREWGEWTYAQA